MPPAAGLSAVRQLLTKGKQGMSDGRPRGYKGKHAGGCLAGLFLIPFYLIRAVFK